MMKYKKHKLQKIKKNNEMGKNSSKTGKGLSKIKNKNSS